MEAIAKTRHLKGSPRKARLVIDLIRGRNVSQALNILKFTDKRAAEPITKTLRSAIANATYLAEQQNIAIDPDDLFVKTCFVDMGAHKNRRRMRPAPQGRAFREQRHYCHITILVSSDAPAQEVTKSTKKSLQTAGEKGGDGAKTKAAPKPKAAKNTEEVKKSAKAEKPLAEESVEAKAPIVETPQAETPVAEIPAVTETATVEEPVVDTPETSEVETPKIEEPIVENIESVETAEVANNESAEATKTEPVAEVTEPVKTQEPSTAKTVESDAENVLEVDSSEITANEQEEKQKAEASNAKDVQSQTPAERNETKKADNAQLDENDILELQ